jgi:hypothetical protein
MKKARLSDDRADLPTGAATALAFAQIPRSKLGQARHERLPEPERELYVWILRRFATSGRPTSAEIREAARRLGLDIERALASLAREDLVHLGDDGEISVAYPFSGRSKGHRVRFRSGHEVEAMCAIDALGIAPMFGETIEIASGDPLTREEVRVRLGPDGEGAWQPASAVVVAGAFDPCGESFRGCCPALNFFASKANGERWLSKHAEVEGLVVSMPDAIGAGRAVFGAVLEASSD